MEPEPKRFTVRWRDGSYRVSDPTLPDEVHAYHVDDPAIVQALAVRKAGHEAGLLDEHGNLRKIIGTLPVTKDGCIVGHQATLYLCASNAIMVWESLCTAHLPLAKPSERPLSMIATKAYSTRSAAERAAGEAGNGGTDGQ